MKAPERLAVAYGLSLLLQTRAVQTFRLEHALEADHYADMRIQVDEQVREFSLEEFKRLLGF